MDTYDLFHIKLSSTIKKYNHILFLLIIFEMNLKLECGKCSSFDITKRALFSCMSEPKLSHTVTTNIHDQINLEG